MSIDVMCVALILYISFRWRYSGDGVKPDLDPATREELSIAVEASDSRERERNEMRKGKKRVRDLITAPREPDATSFERTLLAPFGLQLRRAPRLSLCCSLASYSSFAVSTLVFHFYFRFSTHAKANGFQKAVCMQSLSRLSF